MNPFSKVVIGNPKVYADSIARQEYRLFPYYAGYGSAFAKNLLSSLRLPPSAIVLDPWNGSGTTTLAANELGLHAIGRDLNPVMVLVAKATLLPKSEASSLVPLAKSILEASHNHDEIEFSDDPLKAWFSPPSATFIRQIETGINRTLFSHPTYRKLTQELPLSEASSLVAYFYVALFRAVRRLLIDFVPTNPTWVKLPLTPNHRRRPSKLAITDAFLSEVSLLSRRLRTCESVSVEKQLTTINLGNSESICLTDQSIDLILSSPPYCTRIDYAVATSIELAVLRCSMTEFNLVRRALMGAATVPAHPLAASPQLGQTCNRFLKKLHGHPSKASATYYLKNHLQYFNSLQRSINEISRVLKQNGKCVLVVQDSYYKDVRNDVPKMAVEMAENSGLTLWLKKDFVTGRSMVGINRRAREYMDKRTTTESVICFSRT